MIANHPLSSPKSISDLLSGLIGKTTTVNSVEASKSNANTPTIVARFDRDDGQAAGAWVCNLDLAAYLGACLTMFPKGAAEDCIKAGKLNEAIFDNVREIFNVAANQFNIKGSPHTKLVSVHTQPGEALPASLAALMAKPAGVTSLEVKVDGYGSGRVSILVS